MGLVALTAIKNDRLNVFFKIATLIVCCLLAITANWNYITVLWVVAFGLLHGNFKRQMLGFFVVAVIVH